MIKETILFISANVLDVVSTYHALSLGGIEGNPLAKLFIEKGLFYALGFKILTISIVLGSMFYLANRGKKKIAQIMLVMIGLCLIVVSLNNIRVVWL